jgi:hypothetical protein
MAYYYPVSLPVENYFFFICFIANGRNFHVMPNKGRSEKSNSPFALVVIPLKRTCLFFLLRCQLYSAAERLMHLQPVSL